MNPVKEGPSAPEAPLEPEEERLLRAVRRLNRNVLGLSVGLILGLLIFVATNWLVLKGGKPLGPHLSLLGQFFIGYSVSFVGSLVGLVYGLVLGYLIGWFIATVYNGVVSFRAHRRTVP